jgi:glucose/arabinose dehydrogenase
MLARRWVFLCLILLSPLCAFAIQVPAGFRDSILVDHLIQPTACEFAPDGRLFILQKQGAVRISKDGRLLSQAALNLAVSDESERGLLGIAFDPAFETNHFIYLYYTTPGGNPKNRVSRFTINGDVIQPNGEVIILDGIRSDAGNHNAGWIQFGRDGKLYVATGDGGANSSNSQSLSSINGKILRINADGTIPADNPFQGQPERRGEIFCYGLRNPWRFTFDSQTGALYIADVGGGSFEELNIGRAGANYGWPGAEGPSGNPNFVNPVFSYPHNAGSAAITGGVVYQGNNFPAQFRGVYFFGDFVLGFIRYLKLTSSNTVEFVRDFSPAAGAVVHFANGPDGALYYVDFGGRIHRIFFASGNNGVPVAKALPNRKSGILPLTVTFSGDGSFDPDGNPLRFEWHFGDGTSARGKVVSHTYSQPQNFVATLTVVDSRGARSNPATIRIFAGDRPPVPIIQTPHPGTSANRGQLIRFSGTATDPDEGVLDPSHLTWTVVLHHNDHTHPFLGPLVGVRNGSFRIPVNDHTTGHVFFRIRLKATDSRGMPIFRFVDVKRN